MKKQYTISLCLFVMLLSSTAFGQHLLTYQSYVKGVDEQDSTFIQVLENKGQLRITSLYDEVKHPIPGYAESVTYVDYFQDSVLTVLMFDVFGVLRSAGNDDNATS